MFVMPGRKFFPTFQIHSNPGTCGTIFKSYRQTWAEKFVKDEFLPQLEFPGRTDAQESSPPRRHFFTTCALHHDIKATPHLKERVKRNQMSGRSHFCIQKVEKILIRRDVMSLVARDSTQMVSQRASRAGTQLRQLKGKIQCIKV